MTLSRSYVPHCIRYAIRYLLRLSMPDVLVHGHQTTDQETAGTGAR